MQQYVGMELAEVRVWVGDPDPADTWKVKIYGMGTHMTSGALLYEQDFTPLLQAEWANVTLTTPVLIDGGDLWISIWVNQTTLTHPIGTDEGPAHPYGDFILSGPSWGHLAPGIDKNWHIQGKLTGEAMETWLSVNPTAGTVAPGGSEDLTVGYDATNLDEGIYMADIYVFSNDLNNTPVIVPVTLDVTGVGPSPTEWILDFEDQEDFSLTFDPWSVIDVDGSPTYGITNHTFPHSGEPMAYIAFNPALVDPPMTEPEIQPYEGERFGACFAAVPDPTNDDWLISPQITLGMNSEFSFWVKSYTDAYGLERYNVAISTTGMNPEDFTLLNTGGYLEAPVEAWEQQVWDISAYDGQTVYCAIQCVTNDAFIFMVDDVRVTTDPVSVAEIPVDVEFVVFPNPARDYVTINSNTSIKQVKVFNYVGQIVAEEVVGDEVYTINTAGYKGGIYFIQIETTEGWSTRKVIIE
jgi:hypothetical protein